MAGALERAVVSLVGSILEAELAPTPQWLLRPAALECSARWDLVCRIYNDLTSLALPGVMPLRGTRRVDAVLKVGDDFADPRSRRDAALQPLSCAQPAALSA